MPSADYAAQLNPSPALVPRTTAATPAEMMALQVQQGQEQDALASQQRVADALMQATQPRPYQWQRKRQGRFAAQPSGLEGIGGMLQGMASNYANQQARQGLKDRQRQEWLNMTPMPPSAAVATSDPSRYGITGEAL